jgi:hypothetical protein
VDLTWDDVNGPDADRVELTSRQRISLFGGWPLTPEMLRARFPGARVIEHSALPEGCHGCHLVQCWTVHVGCTVPCERVEAGRAAEARWEAEEAYDRANAAYEAELAALWRRHETEVADLELAGQQVRERVEAWRTAVDAKHWHEVQDSEAMWRDWDVYNAREREQRERHDREYKELTARQPPFPSHWKPAASA